MTLTKLVKAVLAGSALVVSLSAGLKVTNNTVATKVEKEVEVASITHQYRD